MEISKLKKIIYGHKNVDVQHLKQFSDKLRDELTSTSVVSDLPKLLPAMIKYAIHENKKFREAALPALVELAGLLDLNKHLKEKPWWAEMKEEILKSVDVIMNLVSTGDEDWSVTWSALILLLGSHLRTELTLLNKLLKVVEKAFKTNNEEVRRQGFECWCKLIDNFSINKQELNNKRRLSLLVIPLKANNHNSPMLCAAKMKTWKHLLSKLDQHNEMTVQLLVTHFLKFMFSGVGSISPACKTLNTECATTFYQMLRNPMLFRILPELFIRQTFACIQHVHNDTTLSISIWEGLLDNLKKNQWNEAHLAELMTCLTNAISTDMGKSKTFANMVSILLSGAHTLPVDVFVKHSKALLALVLEPRILVHFTEAWFNELLNLITLTADNLLPQDIVGDIITKLNSLGTSDLFRDEKLKIPRGLWMTMTNVVCKWADGGQGRMEANVQNIHQLLFYGAATLSSMWNKLQLKSWKTLYSECVKYFSLSTEVKSEKFVSDLVELLREGVHDKKIPVHVGLDLLSIIFEFHLTKDLSSILPLMMEIADSVISSFQNDVSGATALLSQYLKVITIAARREPALINDIITVTDKMIQTLEDTPLVEVEKTRNMILKVQIQLNNLKPCRSQDRSDFPSGSSGPPSSSPTMTSFLHRLAKSKETKAKVVSPATSQSSEASSSPGHTPKSKNISSPFCDMKSEGYVFVAPKPRKIILTDHQKESLATRKHDIPALYQDLSQDSSQSPLDSIFTTAQGSKKEYVDKGYTLRSPNKENSFKEISFKNMSPRKSIAFSLIKNTASSDDKLQNNKENDFFNNNTKSTNLKEINSPRSTEDVSSKENNQQFFTSLKDDQQKSQEKGQDNDVDLPSLRPRKSTNQTINEENIKAASSCAIDLETIDQPPTREELSNHSEKNNKVNDNIYANYTKTKQVGIRLRTPENVIIGTTPENIIIGTTPKRSLRKKLDISVKKSTKKGKTQIDKNEPSLTSSATGIKSPTNSPSTPKISPRRLRKRKSGLTPILTGGEFNKKSKVLQSPASNKNTPTNKINQSLNRKHSTLDSEHGDKNDKIKSKDDREETNVLPNEKPQNNVYPKSNEELVVKPSRIQKDERKLVSNIESETDKSISKTDSDEINPPAKHKGKNVKDSHECSDNISIIVSHSETQIKSITTAEEEKNELDSRSAVDESKYSVLKIQTSFKNCIPNTDMACSPVKVVVARLPDEFVVNTKQCAITEDKDHSVEALEKNEFNKSKSSVKNLVSFLSKSEGKNSADISDISFTSDVKSDAVKEQNRESTKTSVEIKLGENVVESVSVVNPKEIDCSTTELKRIEESKKLSSKESLNECKAVFKLERNVNNDNIAKRVSQNKFIENDKSQSIDNSPKHRRTRSMDKKPICITIDSDEEIEPIEIVDIGQGLLKISSEESNDLKTTKAKETETSKSLSTQVVSERIPKVTETSNSHITKSEQRLPSKNLVEVTEEKETKTSKSLPTQVVSERIPKVTETTNSHITKCEQRSPSKNLVKITEEKETEKSKSLSTEIVTERIPKVSDTSNSHMTKCEERSHGKNLVENTEEKGTSTSSYTPSISQNITKITETSDSHITQCEQMSVNTLVKNTDVKETKTLLSILPESTTKITETCGSHLTPYKKKSSENTPVKSSQKSLKQTQLPFTPVQKPVMSQPKSPVTTETVLNDKQNASPSKFNLTQENAPMIVLTRIEKPEHIENLLCKLESENKKDVVVEMNSKDLNKNTKETNEAKPIEKDTNVELSDSNIPDSRQEIQRTPEKASTSLVVCLDRTEIEKSQNYVTESQDKMTESEDIIASSQENDITANGFSILTSSRDSSSCNSIKLLSKSPKKCENFSPIQRVLRSSPSKIDTQRFSITPLKKSVCRRLDVEIEKSPDEVEDSTQGIPLECIETNRTHDGKVINHDSEELIDDFKLLNGDGVAADSNIENHNLSSSEMPQARKQSEAAQPNNEDSLPYSHNHLKRFTADSNAVGSPKRAMVSLRLEGNDSPKSSPNSRTSQMMELAKQENERTISSPISSIKKRRLLPTRIGPVTRTTKSHVVQRSHNGPSEEWVRRTYSPTASPNSSILKRSQPVSPDSSPPSSKKKRVSFLDPPVSESLLFSKANPETGQIHRPEPKHDDSEVVLQHGSSQESMSEELPSQGSVSAEVPSATCHSEAKVFSPLKQCSSPLTDILERLVSLQWMKELEAQLHRLGVTTVGQLSSLPQETVERLPFIPPKLERLRKILQNYYNEINEKSEDLGLISSDRNEDECPSLDVGKSTAQSGSPEEAAGDSESLEGDISGIAESMRRKIEQHPELVSELGKTLHIDIVMKLLDFAVSKLKNENDKR